MNTDTYEAWENLKAAYTSYFTTIQHYTEFIVKTCNLTVNKLISQS